jgi:hypothetical protein
MSEPQRQQPQGQPQSVPHLGFRQGLSPAAYTQFAHMSAEDMRKLAIPEQNISVIEAHRPQLQRQWEQQQQQQQQMRAAAAGQPNRQQQPVPPVPSLPSGPQQSHAPSQQAPMPPTSNLPVPVQPGRLFDQRPPINQSSIPPQTSGAQTARKYYRPTQDQIKAAVDFVRLAVENHATKRSFLFCLCAFNFNSIFIQVETSHMLWSLITRRACTCSTLISYGGMFMRPRRSWVCIMHCSGTN